MTGWNQAKRPTVWTGGVGGLPLQEFVLLEVGVHQTRMQLSSGPQTDDHNMHSWASSAGLTSWYGRKLHCHPTNKWNIWCEFNKISHSQWNKQCHSIQRHRIDSMENRPKNIPYTIESTCQLVNSFYCHICWAGESIQVQGTWTSRWFNQGQKFLINSLSATQGKDAMYVRTFHIQPQRHPHGIHT